MNRKDEFIAAFSKPGFADQDVSALPVSRLTSLARKTCHNFATVAAAP
jgi:hypothetical protein